MNNVNLFNFSFGIQDILESSAGSLLPEAKQIASSIVQDAGLEDVYSATNLQNMINVCISPDVGDGVLLQADKFSQILDSVAHTLSNSNDPLVQDFVQNDLIPQLNNEDLLKTYVGLMVGA